MIYVWGKCGVCGKEKVVEVRREGLICERCKMPMDYWDHKPMMHCPIVTGDKKEEHVPDSG